MDVFVGADGTEVILLVVEFDDELDWKRVVKYPAKYMLDPLLLGYISCTGPLRPWKGTDFQVEEDVDHRATFEPVDGDTKDPPIQT